MGGTTHSAIAGERCRIRVLSLAGGPSHARLRQEPGTGAKNSRGRRLCADPTLGRHLRSSLCLLGSGCGNCGGAAVAARFCVCRRGGTIIRQDSGFSEAPLAEGFNHGSPAGIVLCQTSPIRRPCLVVKAVCSTPCLCI